MKMPSQSSRPLTAGAPPGVPRADGAASYLLSSFELRSGLEVSALALSALPAELARELQRLAHSWDRPRLAA